MHFGGNPEPLRRTGETIQIPVLEPWGREGQRGDARRDGTTETRGPPRGLEQSRKCPRVGGRSPGLSGATGSGSASAAVGERVLSAAGWRAQVRPRPARPRPRPDLGERPRPGPGEWLRISQCSHLSLGWSGVRASAFVGSVLRYRRRRPGGVCCSAAAGGPPAGKP